MVPCDMPAHQGGIQSAFSFIFGMVGFRESTREIPGHHAKPDSLKTKSLLLKSFLVNENILA